MQDFQTILKSKRAYYGNTEAAIEFAAREYSDQFVQQDVAQSLTLLVDNLNETIRYLNIIALQTKSASPTAEPPPPPPPPPGRELGKPIQDSLIKHAEISKACWEMIDSLFPGVLLKPVALQPHITIHEEDTLTYVVAVSNKNRDSLIVNPEYVPEIVEKEGYQCIKFTRK